MCAGSHAALCNFGKYEGDFIALQASGTYSETPSLCNWTVIDERYYGIAAGPPRPPGTQDYGGRPTIYYIMYNLLVCM